MVVLLVFGCKGLFYRTLRSRKLIYIMVKVARFLTLPNHCNHSSFLSLYDEISVITYAILANITAQISSRGRPIYTTIETVPCTMMPIDIHLRKVCVKDKSKLAKLGCNVRK